MASVEVVYEGGEYFVGRRFKSKAAAQRATDDLLVINEAAFTPKPFPTGDGVRELTPAQEELQARQMEEPDGLKAGEAFQPHNGTSGIPLNLPAEDAE